MQKSKSAGEETGECLFSSFQVLKYWNAINSELDSLINLGKNGVLQSCKGEFDCFCRSAKGLTFLKQWSLFLEEGNIKGHP